MIKLIVASVLLIGLTACHEVRHGRTSFYDDTTVVAQPVPEVPVPAPVTPPVLPPTPPDSSVNTGPDVVDLDSAENYTILAKTGVSNVTGSSIVGNLGASPVAASYITG